MRTTEESREWVIQARKGLETRSRNQKSWRKGGRSYWRDFGSKMTPTQCWGKLCKALHESIKASSVIEDVTGEREPARKNSISDGECLCSGSRKLPPLCWGHRSQGGPWGCGRRRTWSSSELAAPWSCPRPVASALHSNRILKEWGEHYLEPHLFRTLAPSFPAFICSSFPSSPLYPSSASSSNSKITLYVKISSYLSLLGPSAVTQKHLYLVLI